MPTGVLGALERCRAGSNQLRGMRCSPCSLAPGCGPPVIPDDSGPQGVEDSLASRQRDGPDCDNSQANGINRLMCRWPRCPNPELADKLSRRRIDAAFVTFVPPNSAHAVASAARAWSLLQGRLSKNATRYPYLNRT